RPPPHRRRLARKRAFDLVVAVPALVVLSPVLAVVAVAVRIALGRPVLFRQERPGLHGRPFVIRKFRTMTDRRDAHGRVLSDAERLTRFGRFLRHTSLDELPELLNVVEGTMSLVGPRPLLTSYLELYSPAQRGRHDVKPGITGWAQVHGRNALSWDEKFALDQWYVEHWTLALDVRILATTLVKMLKREGITMAGSATAEPFTGSGEDPAATSEQLDVAQREAPTGGREGGGGDAPGHQRRPLPDQR
ncbi:MAG TPA: sugar transferase, partial [Acidimicrobiales bacterium]|nr:sugar transferase [Acidimicrobiales bacterium]